jgi:hypothetical protein
MTEAKGSANVVPPEVRAAMESAGATLTTDPGTGSTSFRLNGFFLARVEVDPLSVVWGNASFGKFFRELFEYQEWLEEFDKASNDARKLLISRGTFGPNTNTTEAAGVTVRKTGNSFFGRTTTYTHPALGEFARLPANFRPISFSSPKVFTPLRLLVELDTMFTPVPWGDSGDRILMSPYQNTLYKTRLRYLNELGQGAGFHILTITTRRAGPEHGFGKTKGDVGPKAVEVPIDQAEGAQDYSETWSTAIRSVVRAFGVDSDIVRVVLDLQQYSPSWAREIVDTTDLTQDLAGDDGALDAYITAHTRSFYRELTRLRQEWEREAGYVDNRLRVLMNGRGARAAVSRLLAQTRVSTEFARLEAAGRLELTVEYLILQPEWAPLFTFAERDLARARLWDHGIDKDLVPPFYT